LFSLDGIALQWVLECKSKFQPNEKLFDGRWTTFKRKISEQFQCINNAQILRHQLHYLRQTTDLEDYILRFQQISSQITDMSEQDKIYAFIDGLQPKLGLYVSEQNPVTLNQAIACAQRRAQFFPRMKRQSDTPERFSRSRGERLSPQERTVLMKLGLCFKFHQKGHIASNCPFKKSLLTKTPPMRSRIPNPSSSTFTKKINELSDPKSSIRKNNLSHSPERSLKSRNESRLPFSSPKLSDDSLMSPTSQSPPNQVHSSRLQLYDMDLNASNGQIFTVDVPNRSALSFIGTLNDIAVNILIDSGASHNFVSSSFIERCKTLTPTSQRVTIKLVDGRVQTNRRIFKGKLKIQEYADEIMFTESPINQYDVILGMSWLSQVNPQIDWKKRILSFIQKETRHKWKSFEIENLFHFSEPSPETRKPRVEFT
jgi:hypothetical protein